MRDTVELCAIAVMGYTSPVLVYPFDVSYSALLWCALITKLTETSVASVYLLQLHKLPNLIISTCISNVVEQIDAHLKRVRVTVNRIPHD